VDISFPSAKNRPYGPILAETHGLTNNVKTGSGISKTMKRKKTEKMKTIGMTLLGHLATGTVYTFIGLLSQGNNANKLFKEFGKVAAWQIKRMLRRLKLQGLIKYDEEDESSPILLTEKGFIRHIKTNFLNFKGKRWDHLWRMILFDIPEKAKTRKAFQKTLKSIGCYQLQKSVYAYPFECKDDILRIAAQIHSSRYVMVYTVPNLGPHEKPAREYYFNR
jgi:DNA-binding transcriptional regulator PaaX